MPIRSLWGRTLCTHLLPLPVFRSSVSRVSQIQRQRQRQMQKGCLRAPRVDAVATGAVVPHSAQQRANAHQCQQRRRASLGLGSTSAPANHPRPPTVRRRPWKPFFGWACNGLDRPSGPLSQPGGRPGRTPILPRCPGFLPCWLAGLMCVFCAYAPVVAPGNSWTSRAAAPFPKRGGPGQHWQNGKHQPGRN